MKKTIIIFLVSLAALLPSKALAGDIDEISKALSQITDSSSREPLYHLIESRKNDGEYYVFKVGDKPTFVRMMKSQRKMTSYESTALVAGIILVLIGLFTFIRWLVTSDD